MTTARNWRTSVISTWTFRDSRVRAWYSSVQASARTTELSRSTVGSLNGKVYLNDILLEKMARSRLKSVNVGTRLHMKKTWDVIFRILRDFRLVTLWTIVMMKERMSSVIAVVAVIILLCFYLFSLNYARQNCGISCCCSLISWILSYFWGVERLLQTTNSQGTREIILNPRSKIFQTHFSEPHFDLQSCLKLLTSKLSSTLVKSPILSQTEKEWFRFVFNFPIV